jgi:hypothetical protein
MEKLIKGPKLRSVGLGFSVELELELKLELRWGLRGGRLIRGRGALSTAWEWAGRPAKG